MQPPMWQFIKWHTRGWFKFSMNYNMCITYKLGSGVGLSQNFRHSPSLQIGGDIEGEFWMWRSDNWHKTPYEMCHLPNCHNTSCGSHVLVLVWIYLSELPQSISSIMIMFSRTYFNLDVYVHMIAHISTRCKYMWVCWQSRLDVMCISRLDSYDHNDIWDDEWWWESRLDLIVEISNRSRWDSLDL